mmetsp:Transcript_71086/g.211927  ORF Transcript_71086/g.211927 Transcript_71086/m.211927 type:complete len:324 (-) Transcript_71086:38-1009(-)
MSRVFWGSWWLVASLWALWLHGQLRQSSRLPPSWVSRSWTALHRAQLPPDSCCGPCMGLVRDPPRVHWIVKTSPKTCTLQSRCGELQDTWARRVLCYNQTVSFMDAGSDRPRGLDPHPRFRYVNYSGSHDSAELGKKEMWEWRYILDQDPGVDWVAAADDDTYFLVDNIMAYLKTLDPSEPMALGRRFVRTLGKLLFNSGGAGFILSRAGIAKAGPYMDECSKKWGREAGDNTAAHCWQRAGVKIADTRDSHGRERFHPFPYDLHLHLTTVSEKDWYYKYSTAIAPLHEGPDCCGENETLSFHYMSGKMRSFVWPPRRKPKSR